MNLAELQERSRTSPLPILVEFWAPWCAPCRAMAPALERSTQAYAGRVEVIKVNADVQPDLARGLNVRSIPTLLVYQKGEEVHRRTGAQSAPQLERLFEQLAAAGEAGGSAKLAIAPGGIDPLTRALRLGSGLFLAGFGIYLASWTLLLVGGLVLFWGGYDRCPIWNLVYPRLKTLWHNASSRT